MRCGLKGISTCCSILALMLCAPAVSQAQQAAPTGEPTVLDPIVVQAPKTTGKRAQPAQSSSAGSSSATKASAPVSAPPAPAQPVTNLDALATSAEKTQASVYDSPGTVTVKSTAEMERQNINNIQQFVQDEPGLSVGNQPGRTGATNFVIRGIGENRVRLEIDGVKVPDFPGTNAGAGTYTRDFIDFDALKRVEIIRGPASSLYGSDAIGGVVAFVTKDPADYLALVNKDWYASTKVGYDGFDESFYSTVTGAARTGAVDSMVVVTRRWVHETDINSKERDANPQDKLTTNVLGKVVYNTYGAGEIKLTGEYFTKDVETDLNSEELTTPAGPFSGPGNRVFSSFGDDETERGRVSLEWNAPVNLVLADDVMARAYATSVDRDEFTKQMRGSTAAAVAPNRRRLTNLEWEQEIYGGEIQATKVHGLLGAKNLLTYGATVDVTTSSRPRDRIEYNLVTGTSTKTFAGELFPNKNFPDTETTQAAVYVQNISQWGALRVIPAVRFDFYDLKVSPDAIFANSSRGLEVSDQQETAVSPKLGATYDLNNNYRAFAQYAHGFRAPPYDNINFGFSNPGSGYEILPNSNLNPETVDGFEAGLRGKFYGGSSFQVSAFYNMYEDFITDVDVTSATSTLQQFQFQNLSNVTIYGFEAKGELFVAPEWSIFGSLAYAHGEDDDTGAPINSVDPLTAVSGVRYRSIASGWGGEVRGRFAADKDRVSADNIFQPAGYATVDALVSYEIAPTFTINAGLFNIFDESYFVAQEVAGLASNNVNLELYRAPGRYFSMNATVRW